VALVKLAVQTSRWYMTRKANSIQIENRFPFRLYL